MTKDEYRKWADRQIKSAYADATEAVGFDVRAEIGKVIQFDTKAAEFLKIEAEAIDREVAARRGLVEYLKTRMGK